MLVFIVFGRRRKEKSIEDFDRGYGRIFIVVQREKEREKVRRKTSMPRITFASGGTFWHWLLEGGTDGEAMGGDENLTKLVVQKGYEGPGVKSG